MEITVPKIHRIAMRIKWNHTQDKVLYLIKWDNLGVWQLLEKIKLNLFYTNDNQISEN